ncbi:hypothetical protein [Luteolibacter soli]|uniref:Type II secretion system protein GspF domain-containing protein n=1 Tax=Luteolibacter soli TaxID=3135280 RepID=A0ABU9AVB3_9BACT
MTLGRWLLIGLPLVLVGGAWLYFGIDERSKPADVMLMRCTGWAYVLIGVVAVSNKKWSRVVASLAWYPLLLLVPIGTVLGILALRLLKDAPGEREEFVKRMKAIPPEEAVRIVKEEALRRFGIREDQLGVSLVGGLRIAPGEVRGFLDDLEVDYGFSLAGEVNAGTASVREMMDAVLRGREGEG